MRTERKKGKSYEVVYVGIFIALIAVCAWISIPVTVPFTLQTLGIFTALGVLGGRRGTMAVLGYLLAGAVGLPVFSGFQGGAGVLAGTTGGYLTGFLLSALLFWGMERLLGQSLLIKGISMLLGLCLCYLAGTCWYMLLYQGGTGIEALFAALSWCVFPFVIPDMLKIGLALFLTRRLSQALRV